MPVLKKIVVQDFRNIELQEVEFSPNVNCISGGNGEGKTNLLDAIWYLSMTRSSLVSSDQFLSRYGTKAFTISGLYTMHNGMSTRFSVQVDDSGKKVRKDDKAYSRISEHIGSLPIVMVSPSDTAMVSEAGDERRRFVNMVLSQMDAEYMSSLQQYNRILLQRNKLLKEGVSDPKLLCAFDMQLERFATPIYEKRKQFCQDLSPAVDRYYSAISGGMEKVSIEYRSDLAKGSLADLLSNARERDALLKYTTVGLQRDDFIFKMDGHPIRRCGSQGQQKSFLVALKFAQYDIMKREYGYAPMLLLDDLFDKLDTSRVSNLLGMVAGSDFGQIFITDSNKVRIHSIVDAITADRAYIETEGGVFKRIDE